MCSPARCARCGKITWTGCGMHLDAVMSNIQPAQRCDCADRATAPATRSDLRRVW